MLVPAVLEKLLQKWAVQCSALPSPLSPRYFCICFVETSWEKYGVGLFPLHTKHQNILKILGSLFFEEIDLKRKVDKQE